MKDERKLVDSGEKSWWRQTRLHAFTTLVGGATVCFLIVLFAPALDANSILGIPFGLLAATLVAPTIIVFLIFLSAKRQRLIDRARGYFDE